MSTNIINPTTTKIYGINAFINRFNNNKETIIDLDCLKDNFKIDYVFDEEVNQVEESPLPAFTSLIYNKKVSQDVSSYHRPPVGPIENFCYCTFCEKIAPSYHAETCPYPDKKSLFLTIEGFYYYIVQRSDYNGTLSNIKEQWINNKLSQKDINNILLVPNSIIAPTGYINSQDLLSEYSKTLTNIKYFDIVKTRGPSKLEYTTATQSFNNTIMLSYEFNNDESLELDKSDVKKTSIRIYENGLINLINIPNNKKHRDLLYKSLIDRITLECVDVNTFNEVIKEELKDLPDKEYNSYEIISNISYIHSINSQFNLWQQKNKYIIDFDKLDNLISPYDENGKIIPGEFTTIQYNDDRPIIELSYKNEKGENKAIKIINWEYSAGKLTRSQTMSREEIKCTIIPTSGIKISLQIHKHGTFQMSMSYCNPTDIRKNICTKITKNELDSKYFEIVKNIFVSIFSKKYNLISLDIDFNSSEETKSARNTVSGNAPPAKPDTTTAVCRTNDPRPGFPSLRPVPYSFSGKCAESRQFIEPMGTLGKDGLYYPCCSAKTKDKMEKYKDYLVQGFPENLRQSKEYGVNSERDVKSGILVPGSTNIGSITKAYINDELKDIKIIDYKGKSTKPKVFIVEILDSKKIININREDLERDTRYFPGLTTFSREQLINCIINTFKKNSTKNEIVNVINQENMAYIKSLIKIPSSTFNPLLTYMDFKLLETVKYYVSSIPNNTVQYYFVVNPDESYFINSYGTKKMITLAEYISETMIFNGFLNETTNKYYIMDILYFTESLENDNYSKKIKILNELEQLYFTLDNEIDFLQFQTNIIKDSKDLLIESQDIFLVFMPESNTLTNFKIWTNTSDILNNETSIALQIIKKTKGNNFTVGYSKEEIKDIQTTIDFNNIFIPKKFKDENNVKIDDYVQFKFEYNLQTNEFSSRPLVPTSRVDKPKLTYKDTLIKLSLILSPIKESLFMNNKIDSKYVWFTPNGDIFEYVNDESPLQMIE